MAISHRSPGSGCVLIASLFALLACSPSISHAQSPLPSVSSPGAGTPLVPEEKSILMSMQDAFTKIAKTAEPWVVNIKAEHSFDNSADSIQPAPTTPPSSGDDTPFPRHAEATGSGEIVSPDGCILTNDHVVEGATFVTVTLSDGREFVGSVTFTDHTSDLAVVKITVEDPLPYATLQTPTRLSRDNGRSRSAVHSICRTR